MLLMWIMLALQQLCDLITTLTPLACLDTIWPTLKCQVLPINTEGQGHLTTRAANFLKWQSYRFVTLYD